MLILIFLILIFTGPFIFSLVKVIGLFKGRHRPADIISDVAEKSKPIIPQVKEAAGLEEKIWYEEELSFLFKLNEKISLALEKSAIAGHLVEEVQRFMNTTSCVLLLADENTGDLRIEAASGVRLESLNDLFILKGESITGKVLSNKELLLINDLKKNSYYNSINQEPYVS